jgi:hypothetical protein
VACQISLHMAQWHVSKTLFLSTKTRVFNFLSQKILRDGLLLVRELPLGRLTINSRDFLHVCLLSSDTWRLETLS